ncbi:D-aminopeptidase dipeptide-binding protein DppA [Cystobacter fuscus DSM 2262]|uniref:D-aminopeptidase dipeptide-binding protein DppA n=1 Tax=Cystobacter fuscus (strain ATCC 25194 / DSM 2262 / NBRC 100088 / M29) TaxID=1242864 RepID=S9QN74_CYSF2|nr:M55 family metallopeptidase [Cystobacter fuscus]EPX57998.1 D-aminopeptidase dipeptide-binding protein DppA [Cystobacter fuscus DSM 2262]
MTGRGAWLVVDVVGVAGVDTLGALLPGAPGAAQARAWMMAEVNAAVEGLLSAGFERVWVSDASCSTVPFPGGEALHPGAEPCSGEDPFAPSWLEDVQAVACVGMHAAAGTGGFGAHTGGPLCVWTCAGRTLSEAELVLALAAEAGVPAVFVSGDDVLRAGLEGRVGYVCTKTAVSTERAVSRAPEEVHEELRRAAARPGQDQTPLPDAPLVLCFKSGHQATLAERTGARRLDAYRVEVSGRTFRERYTHARRAVAAAGRVLPGAGPGSFVFNPEALALLRLPGPSEAPPPAREREAERALGAFLALTAGEDDASRALRALTLHMLEGHAPGVFARWGLGARVEEAVEALTGVSLEFPAGLPPEVGMSRVDAWYVRGERDLSTAPLAPAALRDYLLHLDDEGYGLHGWLLGEIAATRGVDVRLSIPERVFRGVSRRADLYWLTHLFLLDTRYLRSPPRAPDASAWTEELLAATPELIEGMDLDLAAEVVFCLQCVGESGGGAHESLLALLAACQRSDGAVGDAHSTAAALLAFAGALERTVSER